jgi:2-polyprenyl-3-methyl-5-hydroxy-6-metoxy-1,4-benzoquinol methylase
MSNHYGDLAAAYVRGMLPELSGVSDLDALMAAAKAHDLKLHRFKKTHELPRVRAVLGILKGLMPGTLLDIGSGRGVFLWPLLEAFPTLQVTSVEKDSRRARHLRAVRDGGINRLRVVEEDAAATGLPENGFAVVTILEVLEHLERPIDVAREAVRLASDAVLVSVPSKPDDNPEHIHLFAKDSLEALLRDAGAASVKVEFVLNHMIALAKV